MNQKRVSFYTLGCKLNFTETSAIASQLRNHGFVKVDFENETDVCVINTCSVTANADKECRKAVNKLLSVSPAAFVAVVGCYAQLKPADIAAIPGVDLVLGANEKFNIQAYLSDVSKNQRALVRSCDIDSVTDFMDAQSEQERTRVFLKLQDGCDYTCAFCTIPLARGSSRSDTIRNAVHRTTTAITNGAKEIVLTGVNLGDFGIRNGNRETTFFNLIKELEKIPGQIRYRISSIEPNLLSKEIIDFVAASQKFVPHFHIPLQSGSDKILRLMRRRYLTELYTNRIHYIKNKMPHCCIGVDVITGFPGETHEDFIETYNYLNALDISYLHVFTYSERDHTTAVEMNDVVPYSERKQRTKMLRILSEKKLRYFYAQQIGKEFNVLFEADNKDGYMHGFTENYIKIRTPFNAELINETIRCKMISVNDFGEMEVEILNINMSFEKQNHINYLIS